MRDSGQNQSVLWRGCSLSDESKDYGKSLWERLSRISMEHMVKQKSRALKLKEKRG